MARERPRPLHSHVNMVQCTQMTSYGHFVLNFKVLFWNFQVFQYCIEIIKPVMIWYHFWRLILIISSVSLTNTSAGRYWQNAVSQYFPNISVSQHQMTFQCTLIQLVNACFLSTAAIRMSYKPDLSSFFRFNCFAFLS